MQNYREILLELFQKTYNWKRTVERDNYAEYQFKAKSGDVDVYFDSIYGTRFEMMFELNKSIKKTGAGDEFMIFSTVIDIIKDFYNTYTKSESIWFEADKTDGDSRAKLYNKMVEKFAKKEGFHFEVNRGNVIDFFTIYFRR